MNRRPVIPFKLTLARSILIGLVLLAVFVTIRRCMYGIGAVSNLNDSFGWGFWICFDLLCGVPLAAGAFTVCAATYLMNKEQFHPLVRPSVLTGFLGYVAVIIALMVDLGRPERIWYMLIYRNGHSPLFEIGLCVMTYTTVLFIEFSPLLWEWLGWKAPMRILSRISMFFIILGVCLSTLHQSSLGTLFIMMSDKVHPLWHSSLLPAFFFISAASAGLAMAVVESAISAKSYGRELEVSLLSKLTKGIPVLLGIYLALKIGELAYTGELGLAFASGRLPALFRIELLAGVVLPIILFSIRAVRQNKVGQISGAVLVIAGLMFNRFNVGWLSQTKPIPASYFPSWMEVSVSIGVIAGMCLVYDWVARHMALFEEEHECGASPHAQPAGPDAHGALPQERLAAPD